MLNVTGSAASNHTPGLDTIKSCAVETPKSWRGSSFASPGDEFWREAIAVADGLIVPNETSPGHNLMSQYVDKANQSLESIRVSRNQNRDIMSEEPSDKRERGGGVEAETCSLSTVKQITSLVKHVSPLPVKHVSPLPVKHFDFLSDGRNSAEGTTHHTITESTNGTTCGHYKKSDSGYDECRGGETTVSVSEYSKLALPNSEDMELQEGPHIPFNLSLPVKENRYLFETKIPDIGSTPSSCKSLQDHLDIGQWLPQEICSAYKKRGISRLYPWQVKLEKKALPLLLFLFFFWVPFSILG